MIGRLTHNPPASLWRRIYLVQHIEASLVGRIGPGTLEELKQEAVLIGREAVFDEVLDALQPATKAVERVT
jgi:hypothetical protein